MPYEVDALTLQYRKRWHIEEFFNVYQKMGWKRAGTQNLHIRYGQMTLAPIAQACYTARRRRGAIHLCQGYGGQVRNRGL